jgi:hypothetical protein
VLGRCAIEDECEDDDEDEKKTGNTMRFLKHLLRLLKEFGEFAWHNKAWWIIPVVLVLLLLGLLIVSGQAVAPFIYTLF